jgi:N-acetylglucosamine-6-phosphate deacetylase
LFALQGGELITPREEKFENLLIEHGKIRLSKGEFDPGSYQAIDVSGCYVTPGLIDLQVNGGPACNLWADPTRAQFNTLCHELVSHGVTAFLPTLITDEIKHLRKNIDFLEKAINEQSNDMNIPGIHLEGPFISPHRAGVHPLQQIIPPAVDTMQMLFSDKIRLITLAPELPGCHELIKFLTRSKVAVSLGHSNATYDQACQAFGELGIKMMTHTFNALPPLHHRAPGAIGAALTNDNVWCCFIADGLHVDPQVLRIALRLKGVERAILVTDMASEGTLSGGLVGSSIFLSQAVRNLVTWGIANFREAIQMATLNPAKALGLDADLGMIANGACADLVVWDAHSLEIKYVFAKGALVNAPC